MVEAVAKGTLVADVVAADTVAGVPPCIMGTFFGGENHVSKTLHRRSSVATETHTHIHQANKEEEKEGAQRRIPFNRSSFFLACRATADPIRAEPAGAEVRSPPSSAAILIFGTVNICFAVKIQALEYWGEQTFQTFSL